MMDAQGNGTHPSSAYETFMQVIDGMLDDDRGPSDRLNSLYYHFCLREPAMMYLAARFCEASPDISYPMTMQGTGGAGARRMYLLACKWGSQHAQLYVAWLLSTGAKPALFERDEDLAQRFLAVAQKVGGPTGPLGFPELAFLEDVELSSIESAIEDFESFAGPVPVPGRPGHVTYDPLPVPSWHTWHDWYEYLDELVDEVFLYPATPEGEAFAQWRTGQNLVADR